jgi:hypothetical protein
MALPPDAEVTTEILRKATLIFAPMASTTACQAMHCPELQVGRIRALTIHHS